ncbi:MAG: phosphatase PAP2 family protein [Candidatus Aminicenantes bacterium]
MNEKTVKISPVWIWGPPLIFSLLAGVIFIFGWNRQLFLMVNGLSSYTGDTLWSVLTFFSDGLVSFVILFPLILRKPRWIWAVLIAAVLFAVFGQTIKHLAQVPRPPKVLSPQDFHVIGPAWGHYSFPSGHSSTAFNLAGVFALTTPRKWLRFLLIGAAVMAASSRMVVGVHWPVDVLAGAAFGWVTIWAGLRLADHSAWGWTGWGQKILGAVLLAASVTLFFVNHTGHSGIMGFQRAVAVVFFVWGGYKYIQVWERPKKKEPVHHKQD